MSDDPRLRGAEIRFGGRTIELKVYVNTDESLEEVLARVQRASKGPFMRMVIVTVGEVPLDQANDLWKAVFSAGRQQVEYEKKQRS